MPGPVILNPIIYVVKCFGKAEGRDLKVQFPKAASFDVRIFVALWMRCREQVFDVSPKKVIEGQKDVDIREMKEAIAAEPQIRFGQVVSHDIQKHEAGVLIAIGGLVTAYYRLNDVSAQVRHISPWNQLEPVVISAGRIENHGNPQATEQPGKLTPNVLSVLKSRSRS